MNPTSSHKSSRFAVIALFLLMLGLLWLRFPDFFAHGHEWFIEANGDGGKVYGVMEYHVRWDTTFSHYEGMNYPFGDHVIPADAMVLYTNALKFLSNIFGDLSWYIRLVLHTGLLLSIVLCVWFLFRLLLFLNVPPWWAVGLAIGLAFLSPQLPRMAVHFGLGHLAVLPALLWGLIKFEETRHWRQSLGLALIISVFSLLHFYFFAIMGMFIGLYMGFRFLQRPSLKAVGYYAGHYGLQVLLPFLCFYLWMNYQDLVTDRPARPWGFLFYKSEWQAVLTSITQPHWRFFGETFKPLTSTQYEGRAYIGLIAAAGFVLLTIRWVYYSFRYPIIQVGGLYRPFWNAAFWASFILLLFSMGYPFVWSGLEHWVDYFGPILQFRSIGRFNWVFFYVINLIVFAEAWRWVAQSGLRSSRIALFLGMLLVLLGEAYFFQRSVDAGLEPTHVRIPDAAEVDFNAYQAILTIPYFNIGSDNIWKDPVGIAIPNTMSLSVASGLPTSNAMLTRTSLSQTLKQMELIIEPYRVPAIFDDYPNNKPLLLMVTKGPESRIEPHRHLWEGLEPIFTDEGYMLYHLPLELYKARIQTRTQELKSLWEADSFMWHAHGDLYSLSEYPDFVMEHFDNKQAGRSLRGNGALQAPGSDRTMLYEGILPGDSTDTEFLFNFWLYMATDLAGRGQFVLELYDHNNTLFSTQYTIQIYNYLKAVDNGWGLLEWPYSFDIRPEHVRLYYNSPEMGNTPAQFDELLIRTQDAQVMQVTRQSYWWNNRMFGNEHQQ